LLQLLLAKLLLLQLLLLLALKVLLIRRLLRHLLRRRHRHPGGGACCAPLISGSLRHHHRAAGSLGVRDRLHTAAGAGCDSVNVRTGGGGANHVHRRRPRRNSRGPLGGQRFGAIAGLGDSARASSRWRGLRLPPARIATGPGSTTGDDAIAQVADSGRPPPIEWRVMASISVSIASLLATREHLVERHLPDAQQVGDAGFVLRKSKRFSSASRCSAIRTLVELGQCLVDERVIGRRRTPS
jgi:hypothetical protein